MLTLSLQPTHGVVINDEITVAVVEIRGDSVRLGIVAANQVSIRTRGAKLEDDSDSDGPGLASVAARLKPVKPSGGQSVALRPPISGSDDNK